MKNNHFKLRDKNIKKLLTRLLIDRVQCIHFPFLFYLGVKNGLGFVRFTYMSWRCFFYFYVFRRNLCSEIKILNLQHCLTDFDVFLCKNALFKVKKRMYIFNKIYMYQIHCLFPIICVFLRNYCLEIKLQHTYQKLNR